MLTKIKREDCINKYPVFPLTWYDKSKKDIEYFYPKVFYSYILTLSSKSIKGHIKLLGSELHGLSEKLHFDGFVFLGDYDIPWINEYNDYKPLAEAWEYLKQNKVGKRFNGALQVDMNDMPVFIKHLSWLSRCNASSPYFYFTDTGQNIVGSICKYGNLHIDMVNKETDILFRDFMNGSQFEYLLDKICDDQFAKSGAIKGRRIKI